MDFNILFLDIWNVFRTFALPKNGQSGRKKTHIQTNSTKSGAKMPVFGLIIQNVVKIDGVTPR